MVVLILSILTLIGVLIFAPLATTPPTNSPDWQALGAVWIPGLLATFPLAWPPVMIIALIIMLRNGGLACIQHIVLRLSLRRLKFIPRNYPLFLDYSAGRILLRKVGGGYIFLHRLVLDYFDSLWTASSQDASVKSRQETLPPEKMLSVPAASIEIYKPGITEVATVPLLPCEHPWRPNARFCAVCGKPVPQ